MGSTVQQNEIVAGVLILKLYRTIRNSISHETRYGKSCQPKRFRSFKMRSMCILEACKYCSQMLYNAVYVMLMAQAQVSA